MENCGHGGTGGGLGWVLLRTASSVNLAMYCKGGAGNAETVLGSFMAAASISEDLQSGIAHSKSTRFHNKEMIILF